MSQKVQLTRMRRLLGAGALVALIGFAPTTALRADTPACPPVQIDGKAVNIEGFQIVAREGGEEVTSADLPVLGSGWRCRAVHAFPHRGLVFVDWFEGAARTSQIIKRTSLLAFTIRDGALLPLRNWTLLFGAEDNDGTHVWTEQSYRLKTTDIGVEVELSGVRRLRVDKHSQPQPHLD